MHLRLTAQPVVLGLGCSTLVVAMGLGNFGGRVGWSGRPVVVLAQTPTPASGVENLPATKTTTVMVEGTPQPVTLQLYEHPDVPLVTYYPTTMTASEACDQEGCFISFTHAGLGAAVFFLFPREARSANQVEPYVLGEDGLLGGSGWTVTGEYSHEGALPHPWAEKAITFQNEDMSSVGVAFLGAAADTAFAAVEIFPPDAGDGFAPQASAILSEARIR